MADLKAVVSFTNVAQVESCTTTLAHGITPSQTLLRIAPQTKPVKPSGTLFLDFGKTHIRLDDCLADSSSFSYNQSGATVGITILDRRWKWGFPVISGHYNVRDINSKIIKDDEDPDKDFAMGDCERTPSILCLECLEAMGEQGFILDDVPDDTRPEVNWVNTNAAQALQGVCDAIGCEVVLQLDGLVAIRKKGVGKAIPKGPVEDYSLTFDLPNRPTAIIARCGPTLWQTDLELEAVGLERDGTIKLVDDLSYKPTGGWEDVDLEYMESLDTGSSAVGGDQDRILALESVYRWFRVKIPITIKGHKEKIRWLRQILPLGASQIYTHKVLKTVENRPAIVWGQWYDLDSGDNITEGTAIQDLETYAFKRSIVPYPSVLDSEKGIIKFNECLYKNEDDRNVKPVLKYRVAVSIRDPLTGEWECHEREKKLDPKSKTEPRVVVFDEVSLHYVAGKTKNEAEVNKELDEYLKAYTKEYQIETPQQVRFAGWLEINPDGAIMSVTWNMDQGGAYTVVQRNSDRGSPTTLPGKLRTMHEKYRKAADASAVRDPQRQMPRAHGSSALARPIPGSGMG